MLRAASEVLVVFVLFALTLQQEAHAKFSCQGRVTGYYADIDAGCQIYHMCDGLGRQFSYSCPNTTLFQQRMLICDHWYMVNCSRSEIDYAANLLIGQKKPFVEDSEKHPYYRTPRPDLLSEPTASEINIIYRKITQNRTDLNLVGVNSDYDQNNGSSGATDKPAYNLPTHWSTQYLKNSVTPSSLNNIPDIVENEENLITTSVNLRSRQSKQDVQNVIPSRGTSREILPTNTNSIESFTESVIKVPVFRAPSPKAINFNSNIFGSNAVRSRERDSFQRKEPVVNFKSIYKATTPVFPNRIELATTESPVDDILVPPNPNDQKENSNVFVRKHATVNFKSIFKATTPVFPTKEELGTTESPIDDILKAPAAATNTENRNSFEKKETVVNFKSQFKATTPVFPTKDELGTTETPVDDILSVPILNSFQKKETAVNFKSQFKATTPVFPTKEELGTTEAPVDDILNVPDAAGIPIEPPSKIFLPPKIEVEDVPESIDLDQSKTNRNIISKTKYTTRLNSEKIVKDLRRMFSIPDYDFPLDTASRPGYDQTLDSFQVNPFLVDIKQRQHAS